MNMKRILGFMGSLLGMLVLTGVTISLVMTFRGLREESLVESPMFQSPIETPTPERPYVTPTLASPYPTKTPSLAMTLTPTLTPLPPRAPTRTPPPVQNDERPIESYIPEPTWEQPFYPVNKPEDAVSIVISDPGFQRTMDSFFFGPHSKAVVVGKPLYIKALSGRYEGYYIVPFYYNDRVIGLAAVGLLQGKGRLVLWSKSESPRFPPLDSDDARVVVEKLGHRVVERPELVYDEGRGNDGFLYGGNATSPFWLVKTQDGRSYYVLYDFSSRSPLIYDIEKRRLVP